MSAPRFFVWRVSALVEQETGTGTWTGTEDKKKKRLVVTLVDSVPTTMSDAEVLKQGLDALLEDETDTHVRAQIVATVALERVDVGRKCVFSFK